MDNFTFLTSLTNDIASFIVSALLIVAYHVYLRHKIKIDPAYSVQSVNRIVRTAWAETIMQDEKNGVLAVQTLRNSTMAATFLASTSVLLIIGVLTLSEQGEKLEAHWHVLNLVGSINPVLWMVKLLLLLLDLFVAFYTFSMCIRIYHHVGFMINIPLRLNHRMITPAHVAAHLNRAGHFYSLGMRSYYYLIPLVFWLFGPHFMLLATIGMLMVLYRIDRAPEITPLEFSDV
ncbi:protein of unknown function DUF599 [Sideroxydans lithotrophicus ES-1]|uniref:DUF599 domain-containing protein n=1 Tax=Sideroxydans lithotrophicus (strain ES-1) TaxID=580332 RepID=D5CRI4_SIDLE|nr:protein of unknown function DUF599 [Sideroxydans lithotrophicus ES-1]